MMLEPWVAVGCAEGLGTGRLASPGRFWLPPFPATILEAWFSSAGGLVVVPIGSGALLETTGGGLLVVPADPGALSETTTGRLFVVPASPGELLGKSTGGELLVVSIALGAYEDVTTDGWLLGEGVLVGETAVELELVTFCCVAGTLNVVGTLGIVVDTLPRFPVIV